jgi:hypothetical protein
MLKRFWRRNKRIIVIALLVYLALTLLIVFGSWDARDVPFDYQIR